MKPINPAKSWGDCVWMIIFLKMCEKMKICGLVSRQAMQLCLVAWHLIFPQQTVLEMVYEQQVIDRIVVIGHEFFATMLWQN